MTTHKRSNSGGGESPHPSFDSDDDASSTSASTSKLSTMSSADNLSVTQHEVKSTNVEVCARVRPLMISSTQERFFETNKQSSPARGGGARTSRITRPSSKLPPRSPAMTTSARRKAPLPNFQEDGGGGAATTTTTPEPDLLNSNDSSSTIVAWEVIPGEDPPTTVQQYAETRIPGRTHSYTLDRVYGPEATTSSLYKESVKPLVTSSVLDGYHASVFCYGQTSTGKTFTMTGTKESPGILPLAVNDVFQLCHEHHEPHVDREYLLRVSYVEIYNEQVIDLLSPPSSSTVIRILEHPTEGVTIRGLREEVVSTPEDVFQLVRAGETRRQVGSTNLNKHSSRSHAIFRLTIESSRVTNNSKRHSSSVRVSSLSLVDLAGSESVRLSGATGDRRKEGQYINKSLMTLGQVVYKLSEWKKQQEGCSSSTTRAPRHIPYRDSKLTRLLQPSLSGNAQICIICNISPQLNHMEESHNTLKFALRAKKIEQHARVTEVTDDKTLLQSYREEIAELKSQLEQAREAQRRLEEQRTTQQAAPTIVDDDTREIEEAIIKMERLILKATSPTVTPRASSPAAIQSEEEEHELLNVLSGDSTDLTGPAPARSLPVADGEQLVVELHRIQGLLGSVLTKHKVVASPPHRDEEMEQLRAQLYENEVATSLRKADSSFLQNQLIEKNNLLAEVSKILEALEKRQADLEAENRSLKDSLFRAKDALASERHEKDILKTRLERVEQTMEEREAQRVTNGVSYHH